MTDPPYGIDYTGKTKDHLQIQNDAAGGDGLEQLLTDAFQAARELMAPGAGFYIWYAIMQSEAVFRTVRQVGWQVRQVLCWNKNSFVLGRQDYHWKHEPCLYGWNEGAAHYWNGGRAQSTVLDFDRPTRSEDHPTMKPIALFDQLIRNSCPADGVVYDPFGGSGTTLLACEQNGRTCWMAELDPRYIAVIIRRWEALTGQKAEQIK